MSLAKKEVKEQLFLAIGMLSLSNNIHDIEQGDFSLVKQIIEAYPELLDA